MIVCGMPDLPPRPATAANAAYRQRFYARWGRENVVVLGRTRFAEYVPIRHRLSVKRSWGGPEDYLLESRRLTVDENRLLILNEGATYGSRIASRLPVLSMGVFFRPGLAPEMQAALRQTARNGWIAARRVSPALTPGFAENIRPAQGAVGRAWMPCAPPSKPARTMSSGWKNRCRRCWPPCGRTRRNGGRAARPCAP